MKQRTGDLASSDEPLEAKLSFLISVFGLHLHSKLISLV